MAKALVIRSSDRDGKSYGGFQWPKSGPVEAPDWSPVAECGNGLHGLRDGIGEWSLCRLSDPSAVWQVVEVDDSEIVAIDGKVKFPRGVVAYSGSLAGAMKIINETRLKVLFDSADVITRATSGNWSPAATSGNAAPAATSGNWSPAATSGNAAPAATSGYESPAATSGNESPAATSGYRAPAATSGNESPAACLGYAGKARAGDLGSIVLTWFDGKRPRHVVAYTGEEGIEPHIWYQLDSAGKIVRCENQDVKVGAA
jgi:hypothetical protein